MAIHHDQLEILARVADEIEGTLVVNALERCGIKAVATGGFTSGLKAEAPTGVQIYVLRSELDNARRALAELRASRASGEADES